MSSAALPRASMYGALLEEDTMDCLGHKGEVRAPSTAASQPELTLEALCRGDDAALRLMRIVRRGLVRLFSYSDESSSSSSLPKLLSVENKTLWPESHPQYTSPTIAARVRTASALADGLQRAGYPRGPVGYQHLLYPKEKIMRDVMEWLLTRLEAHHHRRSADAASSKQSKVSRAAVYTPEDEARYARAVTRASEATARARRLQALVRSAEQRKEDLESKIALAEKSSSLAQADAEGNAGKLAEMVRAGTERLMSLLTEWETHRQDFLERLRAKDQSESKVREELKRTQQALEETRAQTKAAMTSLWRLNHASDAFSPEDAESSAAREMRDVFTPDDRSRVMLRVLDSQKQLRKQDTEISKLSREIATIRRELAHASEALTSSEVATEAVVYEAAKEDPNKISSYRFMINLRERFEDLMATESEYFDVEGEERALQAKLASMRDRVDVADLERVRADLRALKSELKSDAGETSTISLESLQEELPVVVRASQASENDPRPMQQSILGLEHLHETEV